MYETLVNCSNTNYKLTKNTELNHLETVMKLKPQYILYNSFIHSNLATLKNENSRFLETIHFQWLQTLLHYL